MVVTLASGRRVNGFQLQSRLVASPAPFLSAPFLSAPFLSAPPLPPSHPQPPCFDKVEYHCRELPQVSFLWRQNNCRDKHVSVETKHVFCRDKGILVQNLCRDQNISSGQTSFCRDKHTFVATKMIFVGAPANDSRERIVLSLG